MSPEDAANFERTLELGKELAADLDQSDVLGRWMAHHISELLTRVQASADTSGSEELHRETREAILALWHHRGKAPLRSRPTYTLDQVLSATARLSDDHPGRYYSLFQNKSEPNQDDLESLQLLKAALELESAVREAVEHAVVRAYEEASSAEAKWLSLSDHLIDDEQRRARRTLARLRSKAQRRRLTDSPATDDLLDDEPVDRRLASTLKRIEALVARVQSDPQPQQIRVEDD
jgi:hypothetical protein